MERHIGFYPKLPEQWVWFASDAGSPEKSLYVVKQWLASLSAGAKVYSLDG